MSLTGELMRYSICDIFFIFLWITLTKAHHHRCRSQLRIMWATRDLGLMLPDRFQHSCRGLQVSNTNVVYSLAATHFPWQSVCYSLMWNETELLLPWKTLPWRHPRADSSSLWHSTYSMQSIIHHFWAFLRHRQMNSMFLQMQRCFLKDTGI